MNTEEAPTGLDIAAASESIGNELFPSQEPPSPETGQDDAPAAVDPPQSEAAASTPDQPNTRAVPKSWAKEYHDYWGKIDPKAQEYIEKREQDFLNGLEQYKTDSAFAKSIRETLNPYKQTLQGLNVNEVQAINALFRADHTLRYAQPAERLQHFKQLAQNYGVDLAGLAAKTETPTAPANPELESVKQQLNSLQSTITAQHEAALQEARGKAQKEVEAFAADEKAHPYFNEVSDEMTLLLKADPKLSLQDAYDRAVRLNPVTYAKEVARIQTETEAKLKENARLEALPKKKAVQANVKSRDTQRTPTETAGTLEDDLKSNLAKIRAKTS